MKRMYLGIGIALAISLVALTGYAMQGSGSKLIGEEKAEQIALEDAGADRQDTVMETTTLEYDRGQYVYDVEFTCGGFEYDYDKTSLATLWTDGVPEHFLSGWECTSSQSVEVLSYGDDVYLLTKEYNNETDRSRTHLWMNGRLIRTYEDISPSGFTIL